MVSGVGEALLDAGREAEGGERPLRIRTGHSYHVGFTITLGQRNTSFVSRALTPLNRVFTFADSFALTPEPGFDAIHSWNAVPLLTRRPYVVTFEDFLPRTPDDRRIGWLEQALLSSLASDRCVGIVAISEYAIRQVRWQHRHAPELDTLLAKTELVYPSTPLRRTRPKRHGERLRLLFVGRDYMRKGGPSLVRAHVALRSLGIPVDTTVVSALQWSPSDYIGPPDAAYVARQHEALRQEGIVHHRSLPSAEVRQLMDDADYLIFPTFHDTFGFVSIEALAGGTPVIATDTCVLPEVVEQGQSGYLLPFENAGPVGKWAWLYKGASPDYLAAYEGAIASVSDALTTQLAEAWEARADYEALSAGALARAASRFDPEASRRRLELIYQKLR